MEQILAFFTFIFVNFKYVFRIKNVDSSGIRTRIVRVEGKLTDHFNHLRHGYSRQ